MTQGQTVNPYGTTLNALVNRIVLMGSEGRFYRYYTYSDKPGMIFYNNIKKPKEVLELEEQVEKAKEMLKSLQCDNYDSKEALQPIDKMNFENIDWQLMGTIGGLVLIVGGIAYLVTPGGGLVMLAALI